ncbi:MAG: carbohydrate ABC transporter permease [Spirochaetes bacterium]|nr:MAG: carbohydrate ABC transporter permease [Spirochaetota bacterium]
MKQLSGKLSKSRKRINIGNLIPDIILYLVVMIICIITIYPFLYVVSASFSDPQALYENRVVLVPVMPFSVQSYKLILRDARIWTGYANTLFYVTFGTAINLLVSILAAYPMSRKRFSGRKFMNIFVSITMFISATGMMIPLYLVVKSLHLLNTRLSILIVFAAFPFYVIILRSFFETIPEELFEAAKLDGASELMILTQIVLPVSGAALATIGLYYLTNRWNGYFWAMVFLNNEKKYPLQVVLRQLIVLASMGEEMDTNIGKAATNAEAVKYATIVVATLPIAVIYPFIQKYFVKGVTLGSVKG